MATLKISDLSVGDWVGCNGKPYRAVIIDALDQTVTIFGNDEQGDIHIEQLAPIPITAEILEKNGWPTDGMYAFLRIDEHLHLEYYYHEHRLRKYFCGKDEWQNHAKVTKRLTFVIPASEMKPIQSAGGVSIFGGGIS